jgi:hypothetical protein
VTSPAGEEEQPAIKPAEPEVQTAPTGVKHRKWDDDFQSTEAEPPAAPSPAAPSFVAKRGTPKTSRTCLLL